MAGTTTPTIPEAIIRFRLRTLFYGTAAAAVLAAVAGAFYRSAKPASRPSLLIFWLSIVVCTALSFWRQFREVFRPISRSDVRFVVTHYNSWRSRPFINLFSVFATLVGIGFSSWMIGSVDSSQRFTWMLCGLSFGSGSAGAILAFIRHPLLLCEEGIPQSKTTTIPWRFIRNAERLGHHVIKLRRLDSDIYIEVPADLHDEVANFIRNKIGSMTES